MLLVLLALGQSKYLSLISFSYVFSIQTSNSVSFQVSLHNTDSSPVLESGVLISAYLIPTGSFINSDYQVLTSSGIASGTLYPTIGTFNLVLCSSDYEDSISEDFTIASSITQLTLVLSLSLDQVVIGQILIVEYEILDNGIPLTEAKDVTISEILNQKLDIIKTETLGFGTGIITIAFSESGKKVIMGLSESLGYASEVEVFETSAKTVTINFSNPFVNYIQPSSPAENFGFLVSVYTDYSLSVLVTEDYVVYVTIDNNGVLTGTTVGVTSEGQKTFLDLSVKSTGTYILTVSGTGNTITSISLESFSVTAIESIEASFNSDFLYVGTSYTVHVSLYDIAGNDYNYESQVSFISINLLIEGNTDFTTSTGVVDSIITCLEPGLLEIIVTSNQKSSQLEDYKISAYCVSELCSNFDINTGVCSNCVELAEKNKEECICKENAIENEGKCTCSSGYIKDLDSCKKCYNMFYNSEVTSYYNENYKSISIVFSEAVSSETISYNCKNLFSLPSILQLYYTSCFWINSRTLLLNFSTFLKGQDFIITLSSDITPANTNCIIPDSPFQTEIQTIFPYPVPEVDLIAPETFSIPCAYENIRIYNQKHISDYIYTWEFNSSYSLGPLIAVKSSEYFIIIDSLDLGELNITAQVKSLLYETVAYQSIVIEITDDIVVPIEFNIKDMSSIKKSEPLVLKAEMLSMCGAQGDFFCMWNFSANFNDIMQNPFYKTSRSDIFYVSPGILASGEVYGFYVNCTIDGYWGYKEIHIKIEQSPLEIKLDRASGIISQHEDLEILAFAYDPDNLNNYNSNLKFLWTCESEGEICYDINDKPLNFNETSSILFIPKKTLQDKTTYKFRATASASTKSAYVEIALAVESRAYGMATITSVDYKYNSKGQIILIGKTSEVAEAKYQWNIYPVVGNIKTKTPYIKIPCNILNPDTNYKIYFTMTSANSITINSYVEISTPKAPVCGTFDLLYFNMKLLSFSANECYSDTDIYYQFGIISEIGKTIWLTPLQLRNTALAYIPSKTKEITMRACSNNMCTVYSKSIDTRRYRNLDILNDIQTELKNTINMPSGIVYYSELVELQEQWDELFMILQYYFLTEPFSEGSFELFLSCLQAIMVKKEFLTELNIELAIETIMQVVLLYDKTITTDEMDILISIINEFANIERIDYLSRLLNIISSYWIKDKFPESNCFVYDSNIIIINSRLSSESLKSYVSPIDSIAISIPSTANIDENTVYDILFVKYPQHNTTFELMFFDSGSLINDNLLLHSPNPINVISTNISITLTGNFDLSSKYSCAYRAIQEIWVEDFCSVSNIVENNITVLIYNQTLYEIYEDLSDSSNSCHLGYSPIIVGSLLIFFLLFFLITASGQVTEKKTDKKQIFLSSYPLVSIFLRNEKGKEFRMVLQLFCPQLLLLCATGVLEIIMTNVDEITDEEYVTFKIGNIVPGIIAFIITESLVIPFYYVNIIRENSTCINFITQSLMGMTIIASFIGASIMNNKFCSNFSLFWTINYLIFAVCHFIIEIAYAMVARCLIGQRKVIEKSAKVHDFSVEIASLNIK